MRLGILKFKGLGGFVGEVTLDFSTYGCLLLDGKNGCGKSSILDSISWVLYDKSLRGVDKGDWINDQCKTGSASLTLIEGDDIYEINRNRNKTTCVLEIFKNGESITAKTVAETQERIEKSILYMSFSVFKNSVMFGQEDLLTLTYGTDSDRKQIIGDILGFEEIDVCCKAVRDDRAKQEVDLVTKQTLYQDKVSKMSSYEGVDTDKVRVMKASISNLCLSISDAEERLRSIESSLLSFGQIKRLSDVNREIRDNIPKLEAFEAEILRCDGLGCANTLGYKVQRDELQSLRGQESSLRTEVGILTKEMEKLCKQANDLRSLDLKQCPTCLQAVDDAHIESILSSYGKELDELTTSHGDKELELSTVKEKVTDASAELKAMEITIESYRKSKEGCVIIEKTIDMLKEERIRISENLLNKGVTTGDETSFLEKKKQLLETKKTSGELKDSLTKEIGVIEEMIKQKTSLGIETIELVQSINGINATIKHLSFLENLLSLRGVKNRILESVIPFMEEETNSYLSVLLPHVNIGIATVKQGKTVIKQELTFNLNDLSSNTTKDFKLFSGGQKKLISLALRLALWKVVYQFSQRRMDILFWDEVFGSLDVENREVTLEFLKNKQRELNIPVILVDHIPDVAEEFDQRIELDINEKGCFISSVVGI